MRHYTFEDSAVVSDLKHWGYWKGKQLTADGFAIENTVARILSGRGDVPGHRVLCPDMPRSAWQINFRVMRLPTDHVSVLIVRYCLPVKADTGEPLQACELADLLSITLSTYKFRLTQAKNRYRRLLFSEPAAEFAELEAS